MTHLKTHLRTFQPSILALFLGYICDYEGLLSKGNIRIGHVYVDSLERFQAYWLHPPVTPSSFTALAFSMRILYRSRGVSGVSPIVPFCRPLDKVVLVVLKRLKRPLNSRSRQLKRPSRPLLS